MRKLILIVVLLMFMVSPALAQEGTTVPIVDPETAVSTIFNAVYGLVIAAFGTAPVTVAIVAVLKRIPSLQVLSAPTLTFVTASTLYVLAIVASITGYTPQFDNLLELVAVALPAFASFVATLIGAPVLYEAAKDHNVAVIGYSRNETE